MTDEYIQDPQEPVSYEIEDTETETEDKIPNKGKVKIHRVIDGDTVEAYINGKKEQIRLIGLDSPEEADQFEHTGQEIYGKEATLQTLWELQGKTITLEMDLVHRDVYGRVQSWIWLDDKLFNEHLVQNGLAYLDTFIPNIQHQDSLVKAQEKARENKAGLWAVDFFDHAPEEEFGLDLTNTKLIIDTPYIDDMPNDKYIQVRRNGIGASDMSTVLGVNPYKQPQELIMEKLAHEPTPEEKAIGDKPAVRKGRDLEPLILAKAKEFFKGSIWKPFHMFRLEDYPFIKINFDGVTGNREQYIPAEIKTITFFGEKYYNPHLPYYDEFNGFRSLPEDISNSNMSIEEKGKHYGIPPMHYVQLQTQMLGLDAPHGYLITLGDKEWTLRVYHIWKDENVQNQIIVESYKKWLKILSIRGEDYEQWAKRQKTPVSFLRRYSSDDV